MKMISVVFGLAALLLAELVFANAVATSVSGTVQVATGTAAPRAVRQGDIVRQGDTITTGGGSSVVLRFDDGQVAALTANSRLAITTYSYNAQAQTGNVLLSLFDGGMRAITGLIGRRQPQQVAYRAATATIGIRGTDVTLVTIAGNVVVTVTEGEISFTFAGQTITIPAGQGVNARTDGTFQRGAASQIAQQLSTTPQGQQFLNAINGLQGLQGAITSAAAGGAGTSGDSGTVGTPGTAGTSSSSGGGSPSAR